MDYTTYFIDSLFYHYNGMTVIVHEDCHMRHCDTVRVRYVGHKGKAIRQDYFTVWADQLRQLHNNKLPE